MNRQSRNPSRLPLRSVWPAICCATGVDVDALLSVAVEIPKLVEQEVPGQGGQGRSLDSAMSEAHYLGWRKCTGSVCKYREPYQVASPQVFEGMSVSARPIWCSDSVLATCDHNVPTTSRARGVADPLYPLQVENLTRNCTDFGVVACRRYPANSGRRIPNMGEACLPSRGSP